MCGSKPAEGSAYETREGACLSIVIVGTRLVRRRPGPSLTRKWSLIARTPYLFALRFALALESTVPPRKFGRALKKPRERDYGTTHYTNQPL